MPTPGDLLSEQHFLLARGQAQKIIIERGASCDLCGAITGTVPCPACGCPHITLRETYRIEET